MLSSEMQWVSQCFRGAHTHLDAGVPSFYTPPVPMLQAGRVSRPHPVFPQAPPCFSTTPVVLKCHDRAWGHEWCCPLRSVCRFGGLGCQYITIVSSLSSEPAIVRDWAQSVILWDRTSASPAQSFTLSRKSWRERNYWVTLLLMPLALDIHWSGAWLVTSMN